MRILLIATNKDDRLMSRMDARPLPIGLAYVAGYLDSSRHTIKMLDLMFSTDYLADTENAVREFAPELVGLSIRNLDNFSYLHTQWALPTAKEVIQKIRTVSEVPIVCGGPAFSILPKECFRFLEPDLGIAGDGGEAFAQLADRLDSGKPYQDLPGLVYEDGDGQIVREGLAASSFHISPRLDGLDMDRYQRAGFGIGILTKLEDFYYPTGTATEETDQAAWRVIRPVDEVVQEVRELKERFGLRKVFFIDSGFNIPLAHAKTLCQAFIDSGLNIHWNSCLAPVPQACDSEIVGLMNRAGCKLVLMAGTGGHQPENGDMESQLESLEKVCHLCEDGGLHYTISQSFGEPGETKETVERKLTFLRGIHPAMANLRVGVRVLPGTPVAEAAMEEGLFTDENELIRPTFYIDGSVRSWIVERLKSEAAQNPRWNLM